MTVPDGDEIRTIQAVRNFRIKHQMSSTTTTKSQEELERESEGEGERRKCR